MLPFEPAIITQGFKELKVPKPYPTWRDENGDFFTSHFGYDIASPLVEGATVCSVVPGLVVTTEQSPASKGGFGKHVVVEHLDGTLGRYAHLSEILCAVGDFLGFGTRIGIEGTTGISTGVHLHFDVYRVRNGIKYFTNPLKYLDMKQEMVQNTSDGKGEFYFQKNGMEEPQLVESARLPAFVATLLQRLGLGKSVAQTWVDQNWRGKKF